MRQKEMGILDLVYADAVDIYGSDRETLLHEDAAVAILPQANQEAITVSGVFDRTKPNLLAPPEYSLPAQGIIVIKESGIWEVGDRFVILTEGQKMPDPTDPSQAHHQEAQVQKEQY